MFVYRPFLSIFICFGNEGSQLPSKEKKVRDGIVPPFFLDDVLIFFCCFTRLELLSFDGLSRLQVNSEKSELIIAFIRGTIYIEVMVTYQKIYLGVLVVVLRWKWEIPPSHVQTSLWVLSSGSEFPKVCKEATIAFERGQGHFKSLLFV